MSLTVLGPGDFDDPLDPGKISMDSTRKTVVSGHCRNDWGLFVADLEKAPSPWRQEPIEIGEDRAIGDQPVGSAVESDMGIECTNLNLQSRNRI